MKLDAAVPTLQSTTGQLQSFLYPVTIQHSGYWFVLYAGDCVGSMSCLRFPFAPLVHWCVMRDNVNHYMSQSIESACGDYRLPLTRWLQAERLIDPDFAQFIIQELL